MCTVDGSGAPFVRVSSDGAGGGSIKNAQWLTNQDVGKWFMVTCDHDSVNNLLGIAVNDETKLTEAWANGVHNVAGNLQVLRTPGQYLGGQVSLLAFWGRMLTTTERTNLYRAGPRFHSRQLPNLTGLSTSTVLWFDFEEQGPIRWRYSSDRSVRLSNSNLDVLTVRVR